MTAKQALFPEKVLRGAVQVADVVRIIGIAAALLIATSLDLAVSQPTPPTDAHWTAGQLDQLTAPVALYPDPLLGSVLAAATYPLEVVEAARWLEDPAHPALRGDDLAEALEGQRWDPSVGDEVIAPLNDYLQKFERRRLPVFVTRDWHPPGHCSLRGGPWPPHCVAGTKGAEPAPGLRLPSGARVISKATRPESDAYSAFEGTDLALQLRNAGVRRVLIGGLATDYCVRATALDALAAGFAVVVLADAVRAVEVQPGDGLGGRFQDLTTGTKVRFVEEAGDLGPQASTVHVIA